MAQVRTPDERKVTGAKAIGFKVRPLNILRTPSHTFSHPPHLLTPSHTHHTFSHLLPQVRPLNIEENFLFGTLRDALREMGGVVLVINRQDKLAQARVPSLSVYACTECVCLHACPRSVTTCACFD